MKSLDNTTLSREKALDEAVKACSNFSSMQDVIDNLIADCKSASNTTEFLKDKCGIILDNSDTGAITGFDAGGSITKTAESVVPESGSPSYPSGNSFTVRGLTVKIPSRGTLTTNQQTVVQGLYSWWIEEALKLIEESYGLSFNESGTTVKEITLKFENKPNSYTLAYVSSDYVASYATGYIYQADELTLTINMGRFRGISSSDVNGKGLNTSLYLDRTLAHELTHAVMAANINYDNILPVFVSKGLAELVHGIDDERDYLIKYFVENPSKLKSYLRLNVDTVGDMGEYAAGYLLFRYLAKQGSTSSTSTTTPTPAPTPTPTTGLNLSNSNNNTVISGTSYADTINTYAYKVTIDGGSGNDYIDDTYWGDGYSSFNGGAGDDLIYNTSNYTTLVGGDGEDTINNWANNSIIFDGKGNDFIFNMNSNNTINGAGGNDTISLYSGSYYGNNIIQYANGDGNDVIIGYQSNDTIKITSGTYSTQKSGSDTIIKVDSGQITLKNYTGTLTIDGTPTPITTSGALNISNSNGNRAINGSSYADTINNSGGYVTINAGAGNDIIYSSEFGNKINAGDGNDSIYADWGSFYTIDGGNGNDTIKVYGSGYISVNGGVGNDVISLGDSSSFNDTIKGGAGNDTIYGDGRNFHLSIFLR